MNTAKFIGKNLSGSMQAGKKIDVATGVHSEPRKLTIISVTPNDDGKLAIMATLDGGVWEGWYDPKEDFLFLSQGEPSPADPPGYGWGV